MPRRDRHDTHPDGAALLCLSHVAYRSGAVADMADLTLLAHDHGALSAVHDPQTSARSPL